MPGTSGPCANGWLQYGRRGSTRRGWDALPGSGPPAPGDGLVGSKSRSPWATRSGATVGLSLRRVRGWRLRALGHAMRPRWSDRELAGIHSLQIRAQLGNGEGPLLFVQPVDHGVDGRIQEDPNSCEPHPGPGKREATPPGGQVNAWGCLCEKTRMRLSPLYPVGPCRTTASGRAIAAGGLEPVSGTSPKAAGDKRIGRGQGDGQQQEARVETSQHLFFRKPDVSDCRPIEGKASHKDEAANAATSPKGGAGLAPARAASTSQPNRPRPLTQPALWPPPG